MAAHVRAAGGVGCSRSERDGGSPTSVDRLLHPLGITPVVLGPVDHLVGDLLQDLARARERRARDLRLVRPQARAHQRLGALEMIRSAVTSISTFGVLSLIANEAASSSSTMMRARPLMRSVSFAPGIRKSSDTRGSSIRLRSESSRLLPRRSGISTRLLSSTRTNPAGSPRGEQSSPLAPELARTKNGAFSMNVR